MGRTANNQKKLNKTQNILVIIISERARERERERERERARRKEGNWKDFESCELCEL